MILDSGVSKISNCTFLNNRAYGGNGGQGQGSNGGGGGGGAGVGGAIFCYVSNATINSSTFYQNECFNGISNASTGSGTTGTSGTKHGGAIANYAESVGTPFKSSVVLKSDFFALNSIFAANSPENLSNRQVGTGNAFMDVSAFGSPSIVPDSIFTQGGATTQASSVISADPKLGSFGDDGGFVGTIPLLTNQSKALDAGNARFAPNSDSRGAARGVVDPDLALLSSVIRCRPSACPRNPSCSSVRTPVPPPMKPI